MLNVHDIGVFVGREQGVKDRLRKNGCQPYAVLTISEITEALYKAGRINEQVKALAEL